MVVRDRRVAHEALPFDPGSGFALVLWLMLPTVFALRIAEKAKVHAIDSDKKAIAALSEALRQAKGLKPIQTETRDLFKMPLVVSELADFDCVVFDPPRAGAEAQARQLAKSKVRIIIAVACDAQSFARDAALLIEGGYHLTSLTPVDQFKYSTHVEIVAHFTRHVY